MIQPPPPPNYLPQYPPPPPPPPSAINYPVFHPSATLHTPPEKIALLTQEIYPKIQCKRYSTLAIDPRRNFLTVYEYEICGHWVIWDFETGYIHLTGIWKAALESQARLGNNGLLTTLERASGRLRAATPSSSRIKADIFKLLESTPKEYQPLIKRIRGGFLKIQGTWLPYELCKVLCSRFCWNIRFELIPLFGSDFPSKCLNPSCEGYGELRLDINRSLLPPPPQYHASLDMPPCKLPQYFHMVNSKSSTCQSSANHPHMNTKGNFNIYSFQETSITPSSPLLYDANDARINQHSFNSILPKTKSPKQSRVAKKRSNNNDKKAKKPPPPTTSLVTSPLKPRFTPVNNNFNGDMQWDASTLSSNEIVDILNASRCLQLLSKGIYDYTPSVVESTRHGSLETTPSQFHPKQMTQVLKENYNFNYSTTPAYLGTSLSTQASTCADHYIPATHNTEGVNRSYKSSVSNPLMATETRPVSMSESKLKLHSRNLSINDLLS